MNFLTSSLVGFLNIEANIFCEWLTKSNLFPHHCNIKVQFYFSGSCFIVVCVLWIVFSYAEHTGLCGVHRDLAKHKSGDGGSQPRHQSRLAQFQRLHVPQAIQDWQGHDAVAFVSISYILEKNNWF